MKLTSIHDMIVSLETLLNGSDLNDWEVGFVKKMVRYKGDTTRLTGPQVEKVEEVFKKHFSLIR